MFDRFNEEARKAVFFARYEASQTGSKQIETEHLVLGLLRPEAPFAQRLLRSAVKIGSVREQVLLHFPSRPPTATSGDMPVSSSLQLVLAAAGDEATRLGERDIGPEHLLLAVVREESSAAAGVLRLQGVTAANIIGGISAVPAPEGVRDMVAAAEKSQARPLVGREAELERIVRILARRTKNNPVLVGEAGVGKTAIIEGLARRFAEAADPRPLVAIDATALTIPGRHSRSAEQLENIVTKYGGSIVFIRGLFNLASAGALWAVLEAMHALEPHLAHGTLQCIATGSPDGLRETVAKAGMLARHFEVVAVQPLSVNDAFRVLCGLKPQFEAFHGVSIAEEAAELAVRASGLFLPGRHLPDRAIDLVDEAASAVKLKGETRAVTAADIQDAISARAGMPADEVRRILAQEDETRFERIAAALTAQLPIDARTWIPFLAGYLARCSPADAEALARAIENAA